MQVSNESETANEPVFESAENESTNENENQEQTTEPTSSALSLLIDEVTSPNSLLSDESYVPSLVELENIPDEYSNDDIPIGSEVQIGIDTIGGSYGGNMQPYVSLPLLKREEIEIELESFSTPPNSPPSQNEVPVKRLPDKKKRNGKGNAKKKSVSGKDFAHNNGSDICRAFYITIIQVFDPNKVKTNTEPSRRSPRIKRVGDLVRAKTSKIIKSTGKPKKKSKKKSKKTVLEESDFEPLPVIDRVDDVKVSYSDADGPGNGHFQNDWDISYLRLKPFLVESFRPMLQTTSVN